MICSSCRQGWHMCRGGTWCYCQHRDPNLPRQLKLFLIAKKFKEDHAELLDHLKEVEDV